jgi:hypothetical protein
MPLPRKPAPHDVAPVDLPATPPKLPQDAVDRFPALAKWEDEWINFWETVRGSIRRRDAEIESRMTDLERRLTALENP